MVAGITNLIFDYSSNYKLQIKSNYSLLLLFSWIISHLTFIIMTIIMVMMILISSRYK